MHPSRCIKISHKNNKNTEMLHNLLKLLTIEGVGIPKV
jgi:hypothetical protein